jgi:hypothetical protein
LFFGTAFAIACHFGSFRPFSAILAVSLASCHHMSTGRFSRYKWVLLLLHLEHKHASKSARRYSPTLTIPNPIGQPLTLWGMITVYMQRIRVVHDSYLKTIRFKANDHFRNAHDKTLSYKLTEYARTTHTCQDRSIYTLAHT